MRYYRILASPNVGGRWFPGEPRLEDGTTLDAREFTACKVYDGPALALPTSVAGPKCSPFTFGPFDMPVVEPGLGGRLQEAAPSDIQLISAVRDDGLVMKVFNVLRCVDCIDHGRTVGEAWPEDSRRPDRTGQYRTVVQLAIDGARTGDVDVLRPLGWRSAVIFSERLVSMLSDADMDGMALAAVT